VKQKMRRIPLGFQEHEQQHLTKMLNAGVIQPSTSAWASFLRLRSPFSNDFPKTIISSKYTKTCVQVRPLRTNCMALLQGTTCFSTLDMASGYYQIELDEESRQKTAFITRYGLFEHTRMGFGLCNAPATFQRAMQ
jgi:hypothetical protein